MAEFQDYDAIVDSDGTKDHATIQSAINALGTSGGSIYVRPGTYTEAVVVPASTNNLEIHCANGVIVKASGADEALDVGGGFTNFKLSGGEWRGVSAAADGIKLGNGVRATIVGAKVGSSTASHKVAKGIVVAGGASEITISKCTIQSPTTGIEVGPSCSHITVESNQIHSPTQVGIEFLATASRVLVNDNQVNGPGSHGVVIRANDSVVGANLLYDCGGSGIYLSGSSRMAVNGNQIYDPERYGIEGDIDANKPTYGNIVANQIFSPSLGNYTQLDDDTMIVTGNVPGDTIGTQHARLHTMVSDSDHQATAWRMFYSDAAGEVAELAIGASGEYLQSQGATAVPTWTGVVDVTSLVTDLTGTAWRILYINGSGDVTALALGADGTVLRGKGASTAPAFETEFGTPANVFGTAAAAGSATTGVRTDATLPIFDATVPSTQAFGDAASAGVVAKAARRDHKHAMPASPTAAWTKVSAGAATASSFILSGLGSYRRYKLLLWAATLEDWTIIFNALGNYTLGYLSPTGADTIDAGMSPIGVFELALPNIAPDNNVLELNLVHRDNSTSGPISFWGQLGAMTYGGSSAAATSISSITVTLDGVMAYNYVLMGSNDVS